MERIPDEYHDLFEKPSIATFASFLPSGHPQVVPVWVDYEEPHLVVVTRTDTRKYENVQHDPRVTITIIDPEDNYRYVEARGEVDEITQEGALAFSDRQAKRYWGVDEYPFERDTERALLYVRPERVVARNVGSPNRQQN
ncbi:MAG: PPOX class F420-dependent oxidoreductase [Halobacterium sp.]